MKLLLSILAGAALAAPGAPAQETIAYQVPEGAVGNQAFGGSLGMLFDVTKTIEVTKLGVFDSGSDGLFRDLTARIYNRDTGVQVAISTFSIADPGELVGGSRFKELSSPVELPAGFHGIMVARGFGAEEPAGNAGISPGSWTTDTGNDAIAFVGTPRYGVATDYPATTDGLPVNRYAAGTFAFIPIGLRPAAPSNLNLTGGDGTLTVSWNPVTAPVEAVSYKVYRAPDRTGPWTEAADIAAPLTSFTQSGLTNRTEYCYRVKAFDSGNVASGFSATVCDSPFPASGGTIGWKVPWNTPGIQDYGGPLGMDFDVNNEITVTRLGIFDHQSDGISTPITARIFDRDNPAIPLAEITFSPLAPGILHRGSRFALLTEPVTLPRGFRGTIVAAGFNATDRNGNVGPAPSPWTTDGGNGSLIFTGRSRYGQVFAPDVMPDTMDNGPANRYAAGTFEFNTTAPLFPGVPVVSAQSPGQNQSVALSWPAVTSPLPAVRYDIYVSEDDLTFTKAGESLTNSHIATGLTNGTLYYFRVRSVAAGGSESLDSQSVSAVPAQPAPGIAYVVPAGTNGGQAFGGTLGMDFQALRTADITQLGCFDSGGDGLFSTITVRLYDRTGTEPVILAEETFSPESPGDLVGGSRFKTLAAPVRIAPGFQGRIVTEGYSELEPVGNDNTGLTLFLTTDDGGQTLLFANGGFFGAAGAYPAVADPGPAHRYAAGTFYFVPTGTVPSGPSNLRIEKLGSDLIIRWDGNGTLQQSTTLGGWTDMPGAVSGEEIPVSGAVKFYRVRP